MKLPKQFIEMANIVVALILFLLATSSREVSAFYVNAGNVVLARSILNHAGFNAEPESYFSLATKWNSWNASAYRGLGYGYLKQAKYGVARVSLAKALELDSNNTIARLWLGYV
jgi:tetratricopeptide (TPR) repeat protein